MTPHLCGRFRHQFKQLRANVNAGRVTTAMQMSHNYIFRKSGIETEVIFFPAKHCALTHIGTFGNVFNLVIVI
jgi:hypothetical protein